MKSRDLAYVRIFDTTLRDGEQTPGVSLTIEDKLEIARQLDRLGVDVIEAGSPMPGLLTQIMRAQHKFENVVSSTMHVHLSHDKCLEIIAVKGKANEIRSLSQELMTKKGVKQLKFTAIAP